MNKRYERYIDYIVSDIKPPYFENMKEMYGLSPNEYPLVFSKLFNQPVTIKGNYVYNEYDNKIYSEYSDGYWERREFDTNGINEIYREDSTGYWWKKEYNSNGDILYYEDSDGDIEDNRYE